MFIGYACVSTADQNLDLQRDALQKMGCERVFEEKKSGKAGTRRSEFEAALSFLRPEDVLVTAALGPPRLRTGIETAIPAAHVRGRRR